MAEQNVQIVRLNARINNQREEIKHKQFTLEQIVTHTSRLLDLLGADPAQPIMLRLASAIEALSPLDGKQPNPDRSSDSRRSVRVEDLGADWVEALASVDRSRKAGAKP